MFVLFLALFVFFFSLLKERNEDVFHFFITERDKSLLPREKLTWVIFRSWFRINFFTFCLFLFLFYFYFLMLFVFLFIIQSLKTSHSIDQTVILVVVARSHLTQSDILLDVVRHLAIIYDAEIFVLQFAWSCSRRSKPPDIGAGED